MTDQPAPERHDESGDADPRLIASIAAGLLAFLVLVPLALTIAYPKAAEQRMAAIPQPDIPEPRLQVDPRADLAAFRQAEARSMASYGWNGEDRQAAHIPIERAMALIAERGLPGWPKP
jgi:hypothetical protein